jgi:hypothetical protein
MSESCGPFPGKSLVTFRIIFSLFIFAIIFQKSPYLASYQLNTHILIIFCIVGQFGVDLTNDDER